MANPQAEPSMDEILASIRRIISEEDDDKKTPAPAASTEPLELEQEAAVDPVDVVAEAAPDPLADTVAEAPEANATEESVQADQNASIDELTVEPTVDGQSSAVEEETVTPFPSAGAAEDLLAETTDVPVAEQPAPSIESGIAETVTTENIAQAAASSLLSNNAASKASEAFGSLERNVRLSSGTGRTIEDLIEAMLQPMLQGWLDDNLPRIVEEKVEEEVRRIARRG